MSDFLKGLKSKFFRDSVTLQLGAILTAAGNFTSAILLAHLLGAHLQGVFVVSISLYSFLFMLLSVGLTQVAVSQVASAAAQNRTEKIASWLAFLAKSYFVLGLILVALGWLVAPRLIARFYSAAELGVDPRQLAQWVSWLTLIPLLDLPRVVVLASLQGTRRMLALAQVESGTEAVRVFLVLIGAVLTASPKGPVLGTIAASAIGSILALERYHRARADSPGAYRLPSFPRIFGHLRDVPLAQGVLNGFKIGALRSMDALALQILPPLIIQAFASSAWVAYFRIAMGFMRFPVLMMQGISRTALPALSELVGLRDLARFKKAFTRITFQGGLLILSGVAVVVPFLPWILGALLPPDYVEPVTLLARILAIGFLAISFCLALDAFYIVTGTLKVAVIINLGGFAITQALTVFLGWRYPETGVAWGVVSTMCWGLMNLVYVYWYFARHADEAPIAPAAAEVGEIAAPRSLS